MAWSRVIALAYLDGFFASAEQLDDPGLRGRPVLVGGTSGRGVVAAASYEARASGCRSAMPMRRALALCPEAAVVRPRFERYKELSAAFRGACLTLTPTIEPLSLDEAFCDLTGTPEGRDPARAGRVLRERVREATGGLSASVGVSVNKFTSKLASEACKPDGLLVVPPEGVGAFVGGRDIGAMWGVGPRGAERLRAIGVRTIGDLLRVPPEVVGRATGGDPSDLVRLAQGLDDRAVDPDRAVRSVSHEETFAEDVGDAEALRRVVADQAERVASRLRRKQLRARTVTLKVRLADFRTFTRSATLAQATDRTEAVRSAAWGLLEAWLAGAGRGRRLRLVGVGASSLEASACEAETLFDASTGVERSRAVDRVADAICAKLGESAVRRGAALEPSRGRVRRENGGPA